MRAAVAVSSVLGATLLVACSVVKEPTREVSPALGNIEQPAARTEVGGTIDVSGWALHPQGEIDRVELLLDGAPIADATYGHARPDVCEVYRERPGCPHVGWRAVADLSAVAPGQHRLSARVAGTFGEQIVPVEVPIVVSPAT